MSGLTVKVTTNELKQAANTVKAKLDIIARAFSEIQTTVNRTTTYWESEAADHYRQAYNEKNDSIDTAIRRLREQITDLEQIAGIYEESERTNTTTSSALPSDVIS